MEPKTIYLRPTARALSHNPTHFTKNKTYKARRQGDTDRYKYNTNRGVSLDYFNDGGEDSYMTEITLTNVIGGKMR